MTAAVNGTILDVSTWITDSHGAKLLELKLALSFNFTDSFFEETSAELVKSPASLIHQPLHDSTSRHVHSSPFGNLHITEDKHNDLEEYKDDFMDESVARVNEERTKDARKYIHRSFQRQ